MNIQEAIERVLITLNATKSPPTVRTYTSGLNKFERFLWDDEVTKVEELRVPGHWVEFAERLAVLDYAPRSRTVYNSAARQLLDWLVLHGHVELSEHGRLTLDTAVSQYRGRARQDIRLPGLDRINAIIEYTETIKDGTFIELRDAALFTFLLETGCRVGEVVELKIGDLDTANLTARVTGKGSKIRHVMFGERTLRALQQWWASAGHAHSFEYVFTGVRGGQLSTRAVRAGIKRIKDAAGQHGMKLTPHGLRHAFATIALARTGNLALVQDLLGHASPETTRVYAQFTDRVKRSEYDRIWDATDSG